MFVKDGVTSSTNSHSTSLCLSTVPTAPQCGHARPFTTIASVSVVRYHDRSITGLTEQDELGIYCKLELTLLPSILHKVVVLIDENFPILEHLSPRLQLLSKVAFLSHSIFLALVSDQGHGCSPPVALVKLVLGNIQTASYFRPRPLVAHLESLPPFEELFIDFSMPIPRLSTERELLREQGTPVTSRASPTDLQFEGVGTYLETLVAQIMAPRLEQLGVMLLTKSPSHYYTCPT